MTSLKALLLIACMGLPATAWSEDQVQMQSSNPRAGGARFLQLGQPVEREMKGKETHTYRIHVEAEQFVHVVVEKEGIDVVVTLRDPSGAELVKMDSLDLAYGPEPISAIAARAGDFDLEITAGDTPPGRYKVRVTELRAPTQADRTRMDAEQNYRRGIELANNGDVASFKAAAEKWEESSRLWYLLGDTYDEALSLGNIGRIYTSLGQAQKALEYFGQALPLQHAMGDWADEANTLAYMGKIHSNLGQKQKALDYYAQSLPLLRAVGDREGEARTLNNMGRVYLDLGEMQKAPGYFSRALPLVRAVGDRAGEASTLDNMGRVADELGEKQKALDYYGQALPLWRAAGERAGEAKTLSRMGKVFSDLGEKEKALGYFGQALARHRAVGDRLGDATTLHEIGRVYSDLGKTEKALDYYGQSLALHRAVGDRAGEAVALGLMSDLWAKQQSPALAIFFGKEAVNVYQSLRRDIQDLDKEVQKTYLNTVAGTYRNLADLLIEQGRLPEAEQVLDALKEQEYSDYVRGNEAKPADALSLTPAERQAEEDYQRSTAQLVAQGARWSELKQKGKARTEAENREFDRLSEVLKTASQGLNEYYSRLYTLFGQNSAANQQKADVRGRVADLSDLVRKLPHTVALYTLEAEKRYNVIVITGSRQPVGREYEICEEELNQKVMAFQQVLREPRRDPRPLAAELYRILVGPVEKDLEQAQAETIVWSLDGTLRYIPMGALYDGKQYLLERYDLVTFTPAGITHLAEVPAVEKLIALAMGISRKYEDGLDPLPKVVGELEEIVRDPAVEEAKGVLPGTMLLDSQFTEKALEEKLNERPAVVHIASHFVLEPGDDQRSYLLLAGKDTGGAGYHLTVAEFRNDQNLDLQGADLLTLSACQTGMSSNKASNGEEVEGLSGVAQEKGAKAVISSLWEVNDASTGDLMADFYRRWVDGTGKVMKVEALRQAQLDLLEGRIKPAPNFTYPSAPTSFSHPYYWAPFILTGNWR